MIDQQRLDRLVEVEMNRRLYSLLMTPRGRVLLVVCGLFIILCVALGGQIYGRHIAANEILAREETIQQLRSERQDLMKESTDQTAKINALQSELAEVKAALEAIMPAENTYNLSPNQSLLVADGLLTIGLVGSPTIRGVNININGKQHAIAAGDAVKIDLDRETKCQVEVQSFDMFKATLNASCVGIVKP